MSPEAGPKVLVVDDVPQNIRLLEALLTPHGYSVISAASGPQALEKASAEGPDLVLLDVLMPDMDGYEVCRRLRADPATRFLPVVMVTSSDLPVRTDATLAEADDFITRPFNQQELLARVRSLVRIKRYHDTIQSQAAELAEWNRTLEARVRDQVEELEKMRRLRRFLSLTLAEADDFITRPFNQQELLARVRSLVRIKRYHDTIESQAAELAEWNRTLEARVREQVEELEKMRRLRRFLSPTFAELILSRGESILESHRAEIAVLFADLRGWTAFSVTTEPEEVLGVVGEFHTAMGRLIQKFEATVGWFAGDGLMVWFNDPIPCPDPAPRAVKMAAEMRTMMTELMSKWRKRGHELDFSVGVALGYATLGQIGFDGRYDYGAVGSVMNLASRLCDEAGGSEVLVSERVFAEVEHLVDAEPAGELILKGFVKPISAFRVIDLKGDEAAAGSASGSEKRPGTVGP